MRNLIFLLFITSAIPALSHPGAGHDHTHAQPAAISKSEAEVRAKKTVAAKVAQGKLTKKWLDKSAKKIYQKSFGHGPEWVVEFHDEAAAVVEQRILYVYVSISGKVLGINFTGQ